MSDDRHTADRRCALSDLAHELGAIASGEVWHSGSSAALHERCTKRFASGLRRLIREEIAAAGAVPHNPHMDAGVHIGSCFRWIGGAYDGQIGEVTAGPFERYAMDPEWRLVTDGASATFFASVLMDRGYFTPEPHARPVPAIDVPRAAEPAPAVVAVDDTFLRLTSDTHTWFEIGDIVTASERDDAHAGRTRVDGVSRSAYVPTAELLTYGDWQRVPAGYVLPTVMEWHAAARRLIEAYRASLADPETGLRGADECMRQMATMAGMEVPA